MGTEEEREDADQLAEGFGAGAEEYFLRELEQVLLNLHSQIINEIDWKG